MSTPTVALHEIAEVKLGRQRSPKDHGGDHMRPYVRAANIGWSGWKLDDVKSMNFTDVEMRTYRLEPGDLLLGEASGSASEVGKPALWEGQIEDCAFQNTLIRVRPWKADSKYLLHYFTYCAASGMFAQRSRGVGIFHLGRKALAEMPVPLPAIEEQRRIAAVLDAAAALRARRDGALARLGTLAHAVFVDMFGPLEVNPQAWPAVEFGRIVRNHQLGLVRGSRELAPGNPWPYVRMNAIRPSGELDLIGLQRAAASSEEVERFRLEPGDLLFNTRNTRELVGKSAIFRGSGDATQGIFLFNNNILRLRFTDHADSEYVNAALRSPPLQQSLDVRKAGTTSVFAIYYKALKTISIPLPPIDIQRTFRERLASIRSQADSMRIGAERLDTLLASLQQRAFRGEL